MFNKPVNNMDTVMIFVTNHLLWMKLTICLNLVYSAQLTQLNPQEYNESCNSWMVKKQTHAGIMVA